MRMSLCRWTQMYKYCYKPVQKSEDPFPLKGAVEGLVHLIREYTYAHLDYLENGYSYCKNLPHSRDNKVVWMQIFLMIAFISRIS
jgi:hypothetical protein